MSRDDGLARADIDTSLFDDPKVVALARRLRDPTQTMVAVGLYLALLLKSWRAGRRLTPGRSCACVVARGQPRAPVRP